MRRSRRKADLPVIDAGVHSARKQLSVWLTVMVSSVKGVVGCRCHLRFSDTRGGFRAGLLLSPSCAHFCLIWPWPGRARNCLCFFSSGFGLDPAPLRHPASIPYNDRTLGRLLARCNTHTTAEHQVLHPLLLFLLHPENGRRNRRPRC